MVPRNKLMTSTISGESSKNINSRDNTANNTRIINNDTNTNTNNDTNNSNTNNNTNSNSNSNNKINSSNNYFPERESLLNPSHLYLLSICMETVPRSMGDLMTSE